MTINSLRTSVGGVYTLTFSGATTIASGGVLIEGTAAASVTFAGAGPITSSSGELILNPAGTATGKLLTLSTPIVDPDANTHLNLIKAQSGTARRRALPILRSSIDSSSLPCSGVLFCLLHSASLRCDRECLY